MHGTRGYGSLVGSRELVSSDLEILSLSCGTFLRIVVLLIVEVKYTNFLKGVSFLVELLYTFFDSD